MAIAYTQPKGQVGMSGSGQVSQNTVPTNSYTGLKSRFGGMTDQVFKKFMGGTGYGGGAGGTGGGFNYGMSYPGPDDPITGGYLKNLRGGAASTTNDYVNRAAYAGPSRAGTGVVGGPDQRSQLSSQAVSQISRLFPQMYDQAMGYGKDYYGAGADYYKSLMSMIPQLQGNELGAAQGQGNFDLSVYGTRDADAQRALDWERQQQALKNQYAREDELDTRDWTRSGSAAEDFTRKQRTNEMQKWAEQQQQEQAARGKKAGAEEELKQALMNWPAFAAKFGSSGGFGPEEWQSILETQIGQQEPLKRQMSVSYTPGSGSISTKNNFGTSYG